MSAREGLDDGSVVAVGETLKPFIKLVRLVTNGSISSVCDEESLIRRAGMTTLLIRGEDGPAKG